MDYEIAPEIQKRLIDLVQRSDTGYLGPIPELGLALQEFALTRWGWQIDEKKVRLAVDVGAAIVEISRLFVSRGDRIMLNSPVYQNFFNWIKELHCEVVDALLIKHEDGSSYALDFEAIEKGYASGVKLHFLCHPHNPVGVIFEATQLEKLAQLAERHGVIVIADEIHGPLVYQTEQYTPFLNVSDVARRVGISVTSASKAFNLAGLKCAQVIVADDHLDERLKGLPEAVHFRASLFGAIAAIAAFKESRSWLEQVRVDLERKSHLLKKLIADHLPSADFHRPHFGYLGWIDLRDSALGEDPAKVLLAQGKVALNPGQSYGPGGKGFVRFNFGTSDHIIEEAITRIKGVL
jgi:cystathionine beta-lyase